MLETVAVILGLIHTAAMLVFVPIWNILSRLNKNISGIGDALGELRLHISEKYSTKDDYYRLERHHVFNVFTHPFEMDLNGVFYLTYLPLCGVSEIFVGIFADFIDR